MVPRLRPVVLPCLFLLLVPGVAAAPVGKPGMAWEPEWTMWGGEVTEVASGNPIVEVDKDNGFFFGGYKWRCVGPLPGPDPVAVRITFKETVTIDNFFDSGHRVSLSYAASRVVVCDPKAP